MSANAMTANCKISDIRICQRYRRDMGDLAALAASIAEIGLLHPIVVAPDNRLIAGQRRLVACRDILGWTEISATVVDLELIAHGEAAENFDRKDLTLSEAVAIKRAIEPSVRAEARERQIDGGRLKSQASGKLPEAFKGQARDKAAAFTGYGTRTLDKAEAIVTAAEAEPERFGRLRDDMDRTNRADGPYRRLKIAQQASAIRKEPPPLPGDGPYRSITADPPWPFDVRQEDPSQRATHPYPQMSIAQICAMPVRSIAHEDCIVWLWTTNHHIREAFLVLEAWGFEYKTMLTWFKDRMGTGDWLRGQTEHCLLAIRGKPIVHLTNQTTALRGPLRANSQKPDEFYAFVESLCPAPRYAELFARQTRENWDGHGDEFGVERGAMNESVEGSA